MAKKVIGDADSESSDPRAASPMDAYIGSRLRIRRLLIGLTQEKLAELLGVTFQQIQKYERGQNRVSASRLFELAAVLGVPVQFFYEDAPVEAQGQITSAENSEQDYSHVLEGFVKADVIALNKAFANVSDPKTRETILDIVRSLAAK